MPKVVTALISRDAANRTELTREEGGRLGMKGTNGKEGQEDFEDNIVSTQDRPGEKT